MFSGRNDARKRWRDEKRHESDEGVAKESTMTDGVYRKFPGLFSSCSQGWETQLAQWVPAALFNLPRREAKSRWHGCACYRNLTNINRKKSEQKRVHKSRTNRYKTGRAYAIPVQTDVSTEYVVRSWNPRKSTPSERFAQKAANVKLGEEQFCFPTAG